jgi:hypothetical protein
MSGPQPPWDQLADSREATMDLPRISELALARGEDGGSLGQAQPPPAEPAADSGLPGLVGWADSFPAPPEPPSQQGEPGEPEPARDPGPWPRPVDAPVRVSPADLRLRLERLPLGHPSSPYEDDGSRKPPPPRLRHLELPTMGDEPQPAGPPRPDPRPPRPDPRPAAAAATEVSGRAELAPALARPGPIEPRTGADGYWEWRGARLTAEQCRVADASYARYVAAEGRNVFGSYGRSGLTPAMRRIEAQLEHGRLAPETERYALRDGNVFRYRLAGLLSRYPGRDPGDLARQIADVVRYAYIFDPECYTAGTWQVHRRLRAHGFELEERRNGWAGPGRRGVTSRWHDPAHQLPFEVQFHTPESWSAPPGGGAGGEPGGSGAAEVLPPPGWTQISDYRIDLG